MRPPTDPGPSSTAYRTGVGIAVLLSALLRLRFVWAPLTTDEGGYLAVARAWAHGRDLYREVWIDRPQGLVALFRLLDWLGAGSTAGARVLAIVAGVVAVVACAVIARLLLGEAAGVLAALVVAVLSSAPDYEGFIANGELLSSAVGASSLAVALTGLLPRISLVRLGVAGVLGGLALSLRQSGLDAFVTALVVVVAVAMFDPIVRPRAVRGIAALLGGFAVPVAVMALHGALTGWSDFWYAVAGYRLDQRSGLRNADWERFWATWGIARPIVLPVVVGSIIALAIGWRSPKRGAFGLLSLWLGLALVAFASGGQFHRHYWVILALPLGTAAGCALATVRARSVRIGLSTALLVTPLLYAGRAIQLPRDEIPWALDNDNRLLKDEAIGRWFDDRRREGDTLYVLCAGAGLYAAAHADPPYPYLWLDGVRNADGAQQRLEDLFRSPARPTYVVVYQGPMRCNASGVVAEVLARDYTPIDTVAGVEILRDRQAD